jgi:hypothetical protein
MAKRARAQDYLYHSDEETVGDDGIVEILKHIHADHVTILEPGATLVVQNAEGTALLTSPQSSSTPLESLTAMKLRINEIIEFMQTPYAPVSINNDNGDMAALKDHWPQPTRAANVNTTLFKTNLLNLFPEMYNNVIMQWGIIEMTLKNTLRPLEFTPVPCNHRYHYMTWLLSKLYPEANNIDHIIKTIEDPGG